jgi:recombination protein RecT
MSDNQLVSFKRDIGTLIERKELALPTNVKPEAFRNAAVVAVQDNPKILNCDRDSVFKSIRTLAAAGLVPDGREAALVPFRTKDGDKCQAMPMVFGLIKMVRRSGTVKDIRAHIVYQREVDEDRFTYIVGDDERLEHNPILFGDRGPAVGGYAIATLNDGSKVREFMSAADIDKVRRAGASQKVYKKGERPRASEEPLGIWADWSEEMWKKTVIRRLCKRLDMSSEDVRRVMTDEDTAPIRDVTPLQEGPSGFAARAAAARRSDDPDQQQDEPEVEDADTIDGEVSDGHPEPDPNALEYAEGETARRDDVSFQDCPYEEPEHALNWQAGWTAQDAKITEEEGE